MPEFKILYNILEYMESNGLASNLVEISINKELVEEINATSKVSHTLEELQKGADKCLAYDWLKQSYIGSGKYNHLRITPKGIGTARSKQKSDEQRNSRSKLKKVSDWIEDHKGLVIALGILLALITLILKFLGGNNGQ